MIQAPYKLLIIGFVVISLAAGGALFFINKTTPTSTQSDQKEQSPQTLLLSDTASSTPVDELPQDPKNKPVVTISSASDFVEYGGEPIVISWSSPNATSCSDDTGGSVRPNGSMLVALKEDYTMDIVCINSVGTTRMSKTIKVKRSPVLETSVSPETVTLGGQASISWSTVNVTSCMDETGKILKLNDSISVKPKKPYTFNITCSGPDGEVKKSVTIDVVYSNVETKPTASQGTSPASPTVLKEAASPTVVTTSPPPNIILIASPSEVQHGQNSTLSWTVVGASKCVSSGGPSGGVWASSDKPISARQTTESLLGPQTYSYTLSCSGVGGSTKETVDIIVAGPAACFLDWGGSITHGKSVTSYQSSKAPYDSTCQSETRTCNNGTLSGSYASKSCSVALPAICKTDWGGSISHGRSTTAYKSPSVPYGSKCESETRVCSNGTLSGTFANKSCTVSVGGECGLPWEGSLAHGKSVTAYKETSVPFDSKCELETRVCDNGKLSGTYASKSCAPADPLSCPLSWGGSVAHGKSTTVYETPAVPYLSVCQPETRTCNNGFLSGLYANPSCTVDAAPAPTAKLTFSTKLPYAGSTATPEQDINDGTKISVTHQEALTFKWSSTGGTSWDNLYTISGCTDYPLLNTNGPVYMNFGTAEGSYTIGGGSTWRGCTYAFTFKVSGPGGDASVTVEIAIVSASCSQLPWVNLSHLSTATAYQFPSAPYGSTCQSETRTCNDGTLSGSYTNQSCEVALPAACSQLPWAPLKHSESINFVYKSSSVTYPAVCESETRTCNDGTLSGSYTNQSCTVSPIAPLVETGASYVTSQRADLYGKVWTNGDPTIAFFIWGAYNTQPNKYKMPVNPNVTADGTYVETLFNNPLSPADILSPNTTYDYKIAAKNSTGVLVEGVIKSFTTLPATVKIFERNTTDTWVAPDNVSTVWLTGSGPGSVSFGSYSASNGSSFVKSPFFVTLGTTYNITLGDSTLTLEY